MLARFSIAAAVLLLAATNVQAGGITWYEIGTPDVGTASAGRAALAMDASTAWGNPAGMSHLEGNQLMLGFQPSYFSTEFDPKEGTTVTGSNGGQAGGFEPVISGFYTHTWESSFALGVALVPSLSQNLEYSEDFVGRYFTVRSSLRTVTLNPSVSFKTSPWLSIGVGVNVVFGALDQTSAVNNEPLDPGLSDGQIRFEKEGTGFGANLGILAEPENGSRFGLTFRSPVTVGFSDGLSAQGIGPNLVAVLDSLGVLGSEVQKDVTMPQEVLLSLYQPVRDHAFVFSAGWQRWEEFGKTDLTIPDSTSTKVTRRRFLDDTWHISGGIHYNLSEPWLLMAGYAYDTSASSNANRTLELPVDAQQRFSGGATYAASEKTTFSFAYLFLNRGKAQVEEQGALAGTVIGEYSSHNAHFLSLSLNRAW
jgi:long-chain fatty acid transport protein